MINPQWLELPMSRTNFHGPKDVRAIEVRLYFSLNEKGSGQDTVAYAASLNYLDLRENVIVTISDVSFLLPDQGLVAICRGHGK